MTRRSHLLLVLLLTFCFSFFSPAVLEAQNPFFHRHYNFNSPALFGLHGQATPDGGYMVFGQLNDTTGPSLEWLLVKLNAYGDVSWWRTYGSPTADIGLSARVLPNGDFVLTGSWASFANDSISLMRTDSQGNILWQQKYTGSMDRNVGQHVLACSDGGFLVLAFTGPNFSEDNYVIKTNTTGDVEWTYRFGTAVRDNIRHAIEMPGGGYLLTGNLDKAGFLMRLGSNGDSLWTTTFQPGDSTLPHALTLTGDGDVVVTGSFATMPNADFSAFMLRTDSLGNPVWNRTFPGRTSWGVVPTPDGGLAIAGRCDTLSTYLSWVMKTDGSGQPQWEQVYGRKTVGELYSIDLQADGGYFCVGYDADSLIFGVIPIDMFALRINGSGLVHRPDPAEPAPVAMTIGPNPFTDRFVIRHALAPKDCRYELLNAQGQILRSGQLQGQQTSLEGLEALPAGPYFLRSWAGDAPWAGTKMLIRTH